MAYDIEKINSSLHADVRGFIEESEAVYALKLSQAVDMIIKNREKSPIVLLSGPSGSGKTTSAKRLDDVFDTHGIKAHTISMDDYFLDPNSESAPRLPNGEPDLESPLCVDWELLSDHFSKLEHGRGIDVPRFDFLTSTRSEIVANLTIGSDEIVIFEGIHALNTRITTDYPNAFRLYISARSDFSHEGKVIWKRTLTRLVRRVIRDRNFRGTSPEETLVNWHKVRDGEKKYISPYRESAHLQLDSTIPYELSLYKTDVTEALSGAPQSAKRYDDAKAVLAAMNNIAPCDDRYVPPQSILREFIGGSMYA